MALKDEHIELIGKYLDGDFTAEEEFAVKELIEEYPEEFAVYEKLWQKSNITQFDTDAAWNKVSQKLYFDEKPKETKVVPLKSVIRWVSVAAAVVIGAFWYTFQSTNNSTEQFIASVDQEIKLKDGSQVMLSQASQMTYTEEEGVRKVDLKGKAFFDVHRDTTKPFIIVAQEAYVQVLGTSFEVAALPTDTIVMVTVTSGRVMVYSQKSAMLSPSETIILTKGEKGYLHKRTGKLVKINDLETASVPKKLRFKNMTLAEMCDSLEKIFDVKINVQNESVRACGNELNIKIHEPDLKTCIEKIEESFGKDNDLQNIIFEEQSPKNYLVKGKGC